MNKLVVLLVFAIYPCSERVSAQDSAKSPTLGETKHVTASGTFDIKLLPSKEEPAIDDPNFGNLSIDKTFLGGLDATSKGHMLSVRTATKGSAGYVALERVEGKLLDRAGSFYLQHSGTMNRGAQHLRLKVVPDSGTGELTGLAGSMDITIEDGVHRYSFTFTLPETGRKEK